MVFSSSGQSRSLSLIHILDTVQGLCLHPQSVKVVEQIVLDVVEPGLDLRPVSYTHLSRQSGYHASYN